MNSRASDNSPSPRGGRRWMLFALLLLLGGIFLIVRRGAKDGSMGVGVQPGERDSKSGLRFSPPSGSGREARPEKAPLLPLPGPDQVKIAEIKRRYETSLQRDAETLPELRELLALRQLYFDATRNTAAAEKAVRDWENAAADPEDSQYRDGTAKAVRSVADLIGNLTLWQEGFEVVLKQDEKEFRKEFATALIDEEVDPGNFASSTGPTPNDLLLVRVALNAKFLRIVSDPRVPAGMFGDAYMKRRAHVTVDESLQRAILKASSAESQAINGEIMAEHRASAKARAEARAANRAR